MAEYQVNIERIYFVNKNNPLQVAYVNVLRQEQTMHDKYSSIFFLGFSIILNIFFACFYDGHGAYKYGMKVVCGFISYSFVYLLLFCIIILCLRRVPTITFFILYSLLAFIASMNIFLSHSLLLKAVFCFSLCIMFMNFGFLLFVKFDFNIKLVRNIAKLFMAESACLISFVVFMVVIFTAQSMFMIHAYDHIDLRMIYSFPILITLILYLTHLFIVLSHIIEMFTATLYTQSLLDNGIDSYIVLQSLKDVFFSFGSLVKLSFLVPIITCGNFLARIIEPNRIFIDNRFIILHEIRTDWQRSVGQYMLDRIDPYPTYYNPFCCIYIGLFQANLLTSLRESFKIMQALRPRSLCSVLIRFILNTIPAIFSLSYFTIVNMQTTLNADISCIKVLIPNGGSRAEILLKAWMFSMYLFSMGYLLNVVLRTITMVLIVVYKIESNTLSKKMKHVYELLEDQFA